MNEQEAPRLSPRVRHWAPLAPLARHVSINDTMRGIIDDGTIDAATERRLEKLLGIGSAGLIFTVVALSLLHGDSWVNALLLTVFGFALGEIVSCRHRQRLALRRGARFKKLLFPQKDHRP